MSQVRTIVGAGLVALDYILVNDEHASARVLAGGTCGNVTTILAFLGWQSHPIARLAPGNNARALRKDLDRFGVDTTFLRSEATGSTPIILHRIHRRPNQPPRHTFSTRCPDCGQWYPPFKAFTKTQAHRVQKKIAKAEVFFFDRATPASIELAHHYKTQGAIVCFEPNGVRDVGLFQRACNTAHIVKYSQTQLMDHADIVDKQNPILRIETFGPDGLRFRLYGQEWVRMQAVEAPLLRDAAGSGDWLTAGLLHKLIKNTGPKVSFARKKIEDALAYGQTLAALNCAFEGARGAMYQVSASELQEAAISILPARKASLPVNASERHRTAPAICIDCAAEPVPKVVKVRSRPTK